MSRSPAARLFVDTNVFLYARGGEHRYRTPCRLLLEAVGRGDLRLEASVEVVQEFTHVLLRRTIPRDDALAEAGEVRRLCLVHAVDGTVLTGALGLLRHYPRLGVRDSVHAATAIAAGLPAIVSTDRAFEGLTELDRADPIDLVDELGLTR